MEILITYFQAVHAVQQVYRLRALQRELMVRKQWNILKLRWLHVYSYEFYCIEFPDDYDSEYSPVCSDIEDVNEDETSEQNNLKDYDKNSLNVMKLMEMIEDTMQSEQEEVEGSLPIELKI